MNYNHLTLLGRLTSEPELRYTQSGTAVCEVGLAVTDRVKKGQEWTEETMFIDVTFWGKTAEVLCEYLGKGSAVLVDGKLKLDKWQHEGKTHYKHKVTCFNMQMVGSKKSGDGTSNSPSRAPAKSSYSEPAMAGANADTPDDIPF